MDAQPDGALWRRMRGTVLAVGSVGALALLICCWVDWSIRTLPDHSGFDFGIAFHPDGNKIASGGRDGVVRVWDVRSGELLADIPDAGGSVAYSPDGAHLAAWSYRQPVRIFDASSYERTCGLTGGQGPVAFHPDGRQVLAVEANASIGVWDVGTGAEIRRLCEPSDPRFKDTRSIAVRHDGRLVAFASGPLHPIKIVQFQDGGVVHTLEGHACWTADVRWSPDGNVLASGGRDHVTKLWDAQSGKEIRTLENNRNGSIYCVAFSHDGRWVARGSFDSTIQVWRLDNGEEVRKIRGHSAGVTSLAFSPDGRMLASGCDDGTVKLWKVDW